LVANKEKSFLISKKTTRTFKKIVLDFFVKTKPQTANRSPHSTSRVSAVAPQSPAPWHLAPEPQTKRKKKEDRKETCSYPALIILNIESRKLYGGGGGALESELQQGTNDPDVFGCA